jgi:hypothetical protein
VFSPIENFFAEQEEPARGCLLFLRTHLRNLNPLISEEWKYRMPFYYYKGKMFCYLWIHKKHKLPYIGFAEGWQLEHPALLMEKKARMKIMLIDPTTDIPVDTIDSILKKALKLYTDARC